MVVVVEPDGLDVVGVVDGLGVVVEPVVVDGPDGVDDSDPLVRTACTWSGTATRATCADVNGLVPPLAATPFRSCPMSFRTSLRSPAIVNDAGQFAHRTRPLPPPAVQ